MAFRIFRLVVGVIMVAVAAWLFVTGISQIRVSGAQALTAALVGPALKVVSGLAVLGIYYFAVWADTGVKRILENIFSIPELLKKIAFTIGLLCIYRIGFHVPLPGLNEEAVRSFMQEQSGGVFGDALEFYSMFTGGSLQQATLFGLGIMPYISASIIFQLLATIVPALEKLRKEGPAGYKKIQEYTRYATVALCVIQGAFWMNYMRADHGGDSLLYPEFQGSVLIYVIGVLALTCGTMFMMWLGEQIDEYGIGNGISLLIMAGIVSRLPIAISSLGDMVDLDLTGASASDQIGPVKIAFLIGAFVFVVAGSILITQGQRRIPIQQAKQMRGRRVYGGQRQYLPLRVNHGGVMPIIFASSLMIFPSMIFRWLNSNYHAEWTRVLDDAMHSGSYVYEVLYVAMIFFFAYFWTTVQFRPKEMAEQLRDYGTFIPGLRPGKRTADYLERVMERITYCGAAFLAVIAVIPQAVNNAMGIPYRISAFLGGTGLLICVSVCLDLVQRIEANLVMRNYGGFLGGSSRIKGANS